MKREDISRALEEIDPAFVEEAADGPVKSTPVRWWQAALPLAACLMLVLTAAWFGSLGVSGPAVGEDGTSAPPEGNAEPVPPPGLVGGVMPESLPTMETVGRVIGFDPDSRTLVLEEADGTELTAVLPETLHVTGMSVGDTVTLHWTGQRGDRLEAEQVVDLIFTEGAVP